MTQISFPYRTFIIIAKIERKTTSEQTGHPCGFSANIVQDTSGAYYAVMGNDYSFLAIQEASTEKDAILAAWDLLSFIIEDRILQYKQEQEEIAKKQAEIKEIKDTKKKEKKETKDLK